MERMKSRLHNQANISGTDIPLSKGIGTNKLLPPTDSFLVGANNPTHPTKFEQGVLKLFADLGSFSPDKDSEVTDVVNQYLDSFPVSKDKLS